MSAELITALVALATALGGIGAMLIWVGRSAQRIDQLESGQTRIEADMARFETSTEAKLDRLIEGIDQKLDRIWTFLHEITNRRRSGSTPPLGDED